MTTSVISQMHKLTLRVPAKALLFGEYGVLYGGPAVAVTFFEHSFLLSVALNPLQSLNLARLRQTKVQIRSDFFSTGVLTFYLQDKMNLTTDRQELFFARLLLPWSSELLGRELHVEVKESFSPDLGFGSSSALIAGFSFALWQFFFPGEDPLCNPRFWEKIRDSLFAVQGTGSGYDVAVQLYAMQSISAESSLSSERSGKPLQFWIFQNQIESFLPMVKQFIPEHGCRDFGSFVKTNLYSDTSLVLKEFQSKENKRELACQHSLIAEKFILSPSKANLVLCVSLAKQQAQRQGLLRVVHKSRHNSFLFLLEQNKISYKTMGAGHGDCLWVLADERFLHEVCGLPLARIPFSFSHQNENCTL